MAEKVLHIEVFALGQAPIKLDGVEANLHGANGEFTVLPGHAALMATLAIGVMEVALPEGQKRRIAVNGGFAEILNDRVVVLTKTAEMDADIDVARAEAAKARAEERIASSDRDTDVGRAEAALKRAMARIRAYGAAGATSKK